MRSRLICNFQPTGVEALFDILSNFFAFKQASSESTSAFAVRMRIMSTRSATAGQTITPTLQVLATLLGLDQQCFGDLHATFENETSDYSNDDLQSFMTKVENFERRKGILLNTSGATTPSARQEIPSVSQVTPGEMTYTWWDRDNLHPNSAIQVLDKFQCSVCKKNNHNLAECPIALSQYTITKKDIPTKVDFPPWLLAKSTGQETQDLAAQGGGRTQGGRGGDRHPHCGCGGRGHGQQARSAIVDLVDPDAQLPAQDITKASLQGDDATATPHTASGSWTQVARDTPAILQAHPPPSIHPRGFTGGVV